MLNAEGGLTEYSYDAVANLIGEKEPLNRVIASAYDALQRRTASTDPLSLITTTDRSKGSGLFE